MRRAAASTLSYLLCWSTCRIWTVCSEVLVPSLPKALHPCYPQLVFVCLATSEKSTRTKSGVTSWLPGGYVVPSVSLNMRKLTQERLFLGPY